LKSKKPCETKYSTISREDVLESFQRERKLPTTECEFCKKVICMKSVKKHLLTCNDKPSQPKAKVADSSSVAQIDNTIVDGTQHPSLNIEERVKYLEQQLEELLKKVVVNDKDSKPNKNKLNKQMRARCWTKYVGEDLARTRCICCQEQMITTFSFECGHVEAHACGGSNDLSNLRPICRDCNNGMGTQNMKKYAKEMFGVDIE
jgi:5-methylcytosine-specific restriction endonuclease McrA